MSSFCDSSLVSVFDSSFGFSIFNFSAFISVFFPLSSFLLKLSFGKNSFVSFSSSSGAFSFSKFKFYFSFVKK